MTIRLACGDFVFDDVLYAVNRSYFLVFTKYSTVQAYKTRCGGPREWVCFKFPGPMGYVSVKNWQNQMTSDEVITNIKR